MVLYKEAYRTEAYVSDEGYVCIKQHQEFGCEEVVVMLSIDQAKMFLADLPDLILMAESEE